MESNSATEPTPFDDGEFYDILMGQMADYDLAFYRQLALEADGPVLDLPCGTGRVLLPLLQEGIDIEGVDLSAEMLAGLRQKAEALGLQPQVHHASFTELRLERQFALIISPCNSFVHNLTAEDQIQSLRLCREHLLPGGLLVIDTFFPGSQFLATDNQRVLEGEITHPSTGNRLRMYDSRSFDRVKQLFDSKNEVEELNTDGRLVSTRQFSTTIRWIYKTEMELLLRIAGFSRWEICGGFDRRPLELETDAMLVFAWK